MELEKILQKITDNEKIKDVKTKLIIILSNKEYKI